MPSFVAREDFLLAPGDSFRAQDRFRFFQIAIRFRKRALAVHHARVGFFAQLLNELRINFHYLHLIER